ncbi:MAG: polyphosphate polymerase domain-containing protein [Clostridia bacterium]|nr:polyphosphate polymerase domain-containing protein [Clostridia bacterium]
MKFRHELKHEISLSDRLAVAARLSAVAKRDLNSIDGKYEIRSLYFDNIKDKALLEKVNGVNFREKFRLRCYNGDTSYIVLEKKSKINGLCNKVSTVISEDEVKKMLAGDIDFMAKSDRALLSELYSKMKSQCLRPKTIVDYTREAFTYAPGNVRVTLDYNIRTGINSKDFLNPNCVTVPVAENITVLEVKWDEFLPEIIRDAVSLKDTRSTAFSKYAVCRIYG